MRPQLIPTIIDLLVPDVLLQLAEYIIKDLASPTQSRFAGVSSMSPMTSTDGYGVLVGSCKTSVEKKRFSKVAVPVVGQPSYGGGWAVNGLAFSIIYRC